MRSGTFKLTLTAVACLSILSFAQLPTLTVKTKNNATPVANSANGICPPGTSSGVMQQNENNSTSGLNLFTLPYIEATEIELSGAADSRHNFKVVSSGKPNASDSIRRRGNSTANTGGGMGGWGGGQTQSKIPFRIKFDKRNSMFGRPAEKSWALVANYYDPSLMQSNIAFYLGRKLGLDFTPNGYYVKLNVANQDRGVYLLTDQIQRSEASVNIDKGDGWLAEFDYHCATSTDDQKRYYHTGSNRYNINVKIREPDLDDLPLNSKSKPDSTCLDFVKNDLNALLDKMKESNFPNNGYRDYIDLDSYAKYILIQLFLDNQDFNGLASNSTLLGSNYAYKNKGEKIKAGPLWDFDLACGSSMGTSFFTTYTQQTEPRHAFYKRLWDDPVFRFKYKKIWNDNKTHFEHIGNVVIDSITNLVAGSYAGNVSASNSINSETTYKQHTAKLKTWWQNRLNHFNTTVNNMSNVANSDVAETPVAVALLNSTRNCKEAVNSNKVKLTCTGLQATVAKGATIAEPTLACNDNSQVTNTNWTGRPQQNSSWEVSTTTGTTSYTISVTANCGSTQGLSANCGTVAVSNETTPIGNAVINLSLGSAKIEVYNLHGKLVYSTYSENPEALKIPVQTGIYIMRTTLGSEKKVQRLVIK